MGFLSGVSVNTSAGKPVIITVYMPTEADEAMSEIVQAAGGLPPTPAEIDGHRSHSRSQASSQTPGSNQDALGGDMETTKPYYPYPVADDGHDDEALWGLPERI